MLTRVGDATIVADRVKQKVPVSSDRVLEAELTQGRSRLIVFYTVLIWKPLEYVACLQMIRK